VIHYDYGSTCSLDKEFAYQLICKVPSVELDEFEVTAQIRGNLGGGAEQLGVYEFDKVYNGASAFKNSNCIVFYSGNSGGWQWVGAYNQWAGDGPLITLVPTAQEFVKSMQFQKGTDE
jgi:hypothetical protein